MKRLGSSLMLICPNSEQNSHVYSGEFQSMLEGLDEDERLEETEQVAGKKRRLSVDQIKVLEKNFEVDNKLEPDRKVELAQELGLQPRQVAVWFQNRRARWKTKQLEKDYGILQANYDSLNLKYDELHYDNKYLHKEIRELKAMLEEGNEKSDLLLKDEIVAAESDDKTIENSDNHPVEKIESLDKKKNNGNIELEMFKGGSSDSDSSAILNEENQLMASKLTDSPPSLNCFQLQKPYYPYYVKMEEHDLFTGEEACNFFSDEQAPSLHWYGAD